MATKKSLKSKKEKLLTISKTILITLACSILLIAIVKRIIHVYGHIAK